MSEHVKDENTAQLVGALCDAAARIYLIEDSEIAKAHNDGAQKMLDAAIAIIRARPAGS